MGGRGRGGRVGGWGKGGREWWPVKNVPFPHAPPILLRAMAQVHGVHRRHREEDRPRGSGEGGGVESLRISRSKREREIGVILCNHGSNVPRVLISGWSFWEGTCLRGFRT